MDFNLPHNCTKCNKEFNYLNPESNEDYYVVQKRSARYRGATASVVYCTGCAPFGNTKIPAQLGLDE
ncbi:hypothetical protein HJTV-1_gp59 [Haloarcula virus HJTV-1]|uniref:Uncharacterized protein n=1 Tax=Halorubrum tailed virus 10 TaxID=2877991 RepID=A0AAE8XTT2_9CAUD|nr:hypothetical protein M1M36_gp075 [Halorubrum tailed virus 10]QRD99683.1 hypothetical protein VOLN27_57 [Halorubrum virus VOLN27B]UBF19766.1 hypothetical protein HRTV-18_gp57 [Halorubrum virus HRTV-18]UBF19889.1 hypothetical protein HRTV-20_gp57 [Halorubrum virus HRTV-20]UBF20013.1 hypothetical protein HRTV-22_gp58 [Halorubrum virus HRTV-22]UBF20140.1 hypothetical protein HRTV-26_gp59 [Halorubrum virus HRTV-26]UBF21182.1 hypothetical protein HJTV-1_gp59 [Haloarcula virus HJTV-1]